jgi:hypothetical protein
VEWGQVGDAVVTAGAISGALTVTVASIVAVVRVLILRPLTARMADQVRVVESRLAGRLDQIDSELTPRHGSSMRDTLERVEARVDAVTLTITSYEARQSTYIRALASSLREQQLTVPRPEDFDIT